MFSAGKYEYKDRFNKEKYVYERDKYREGEITITLVQKESYEKEQSSVLGTLISAVDKSAIPQAKIYVRRGWNVRDGRQVQCVTSDEKGSYSIKGLPYGMYTLEYVRPGYVKKYETVIVGNTPVTLNVTMAPGTVGNEAFIVLTWGYNPRDLDSHLECYQDGKLRYHIYYVMKGFMGEAEMDVDDTNGYGPETIKFQLDDRYDYRYYVHLYSGYGSLSASMAQVEFIYHNKSVRYNVSTEKDYGRDWVVFEIHNGILVPVD